MKRPSRLVLATVAWIVPALLGAGASGANQAISIDPAELSVLPVVKERVSVVVTGGSIIGGHFGGQMDACGVGTQAFVEKVGQWQRCQQSPLGGTCADEGGADLFAGLTCYDADHIKASSVHDVIEETTGDFLVTGEVLLAWESGPASETVTARGAFILRLGPDGTPLQSACIGPQPGGPPADEGCCTALCELDNGSGSGSSDGSCGGRAVAVVDADQIVATGWCESPLGVWPVNRNYFVASFSGDLAIQQWSEQSTCMAEEVGRAIAVAPDGDIFVTGFGEKDHDIFVARYSFDGTQMAYESGGGPLLDEGRSIHFDGEGNAVIEGVVNEEAPFGEVTLGGAGEGQQDFSMTLDDELGVVGFNMAPIQQIVPLPVGLDPIELGLQADNTEVAGIPFKAMQMPFGIPNPPPAPPPPPPPPPQTENLLAVDLHVEAGTVKGGSLEGLVSSSGDLVITEGEDPDEPGSAVTPLPHRDEGCA